MCPVITVKSLGSPTKDDICVELDSHADTSVLGSNVLVAHDHEFYIDVYGYDSKCRHKNITNVDAAVVCDDQHIGDMSVF